MTKRGMWKFCCVFWAGFWFLAGVFFFPLWMFSLLSLSLIMIPVGVPEKRKELPDDRIR